MDFIKRKKTRVVKIGDVLIGGDNPVAIQSMCNTKTSDVEATVKQILALENEGCEIIRVAVPDMAAAEAISEIKKQIHIPLVADIHFDYRLALKAIENGVDKLRINPGNIGGEDRVKAVVEAAKAKNIPIRIGVNSGSLEKDILEKYGKVTPEGLVESAMRHVRILEKLDFRDIVISIKASSVPFSLASDIILLTGAESGFTTAIILEAFIRLLKPIPTKLFSTSSSPLFYILNLLTNFFYLAFKFYGILGNKKVAGF